ncbi:MAG: DUF6702 family protein [Pseudomonadota bacterium]
MTRQVRRVGLLFAALLLSLPVAAHQQKEAITRILFNSNTSNIEVMHRFLLHDAEHAMRELFKQPADLLGDNADRDRFQSYVHARFSLADQDGKGLVLTPVGAEIDGKFLWVYAETPIPAGLTALTISHDGLRDVWSDQVNLVNVDRNDTVQSAVFAKNRREATIRFENSETAADAER